MLVEMINQQGADGTTEPTVFGPFHVEGAPRREMGESIASDTSAPALTFTGVVRDLDGQPIEGAELDVWQNAPNGLYDVQDADVEGMDMRGRFVTGPDGRYAFDTIRPIAYKIPDDGPVGKMVEQAGRHPWRPAHTHVMLSADGYKRVITHLFDAASDYLDSDIVFGVRESLIADMSGDTLSYDFVLEPA
jgi:catechol 1,2-dioxygenase